MTDSPPPTVPTTDCPWSCSIVTPHRHTGFPGDPGDCVTYTGAWLAYYVDRSGMAIFGSEVEALRYAVEESMQVRFWPFGTGFNRVIDGPPGQRGRWPAPFPGVAKSGAPLADTTPEG